MGYMTRLVKLGRAKVDAIEVVAIEPQGKRGKRTAVHLRGGQTVVVPFSAEEVDWQIWGGGVWTAEREFEEGFRRPEGVFARPTFEATEEELEGVQRVERAAFYPDAVVHPTARPGHMPVRLPSTEPRTWPDDPLRPGWKKLGEFSIPVDQLDGSDRIDMRRGTDRLRAEPEELEAEDEAHEESGAYAEERRRQRRLHGMLDRLVDEGLISQSLRPMFSRRRATFLVIDKEYPDQCYELKRLADDLWFAELRRLEEDSPESCASILEARRLLDLKVIPAQIPWLRAKVEAAFADLDRYWGRENYEHAAKLQAFLDEYPETQEDGDK